jgi:type II secretory pathway pseudopilin PulG
MRFERGATLVDLLAALSILAMAMAIAVPNLETARRRAGLDSIARTIIASLQLCRMQAFKCGRKAGLVFFHDGARWSFTPVVDGDGDGVSRKDLGRGIDAALAPTTWLDALSAGATLGVPKGWRVPDPSGHGRLHTSDGLAAGTSDIISFSALGDATPSSVYLNDGQRRMLALRIYGGTARVRILEWRRGWARWRQISM